MNDNTNTLKWDLQTFAEPTEPTAPEPANNTPDTLADNIQDSQTDQTQGNPQNNNEPANDKPDGPKSLLNQAAGNDNIAYDFTQSIPDGYELDEATSKAFGDICRGMNLNNEQANQLAAYGYQWQQSIMAKMQEEQQAAYLKEAEDTKAFFGTNFKGTMENVNVAVNILEREYPGFVDALEKGGVGNNKAVLQVLAKVGTMLKEDPGVGGGTPAKANNNPYPNTNWDNL